MGDDKKTINIATVDFSRPEDLVAQVNGTKHNGSIGTVVDSTDPLVTTIGKVWCALLGVTEVKQSDDFFELGGHSLLVPQLLAMVRQETKVEVPFRVFFESPTVKGVASVVASLQAQR
jgi:acyl carrier protein